MSYDEELSRVVTFATVAKDALPNVKVAAPSTCSWWYYWTSAVGYSDTAAHNNVDFLPWFLGQMKSASTTAGERLLGEQNSTHSAEAWTDLSFPVRLP
jgi:hypothetical protein